MVVFRYIKKITPIPKIKELSKMLTLSLTKNLIEIAKNRNNLYLISKSGYQFKKNI
jgi:hypothetical protein